MPSKTNKTETGVVHESRGKLYQLLGVAILLLLALGAIGYWLIENYDPEPVATEIEVTDNTDSTILFTAFDETQGVTVYALDLATENSQPQRISPFAVSGFVEFKDQENPDEFFFSGISDLSNEGDDVVGIHSYALSSETNLQLQYYSGSAGYSESNLEWSSVAQLLAFESASTEEGGDSLEGRSVVVFDPEANAVVRTFANAVQPHWSPDGTKLLFMQEDGFYMYDREVQEVQRVFVEDESRILTTDVQTTLSQDGSTFVITSPGAYISILSIQSWEPFNYITSGSVAVSDTRLFQPLLSPDGGQLAVLAIDVVSTDETGAARELANPRLEIRNVAKPDEIAYSQSLESYDVARLYLDDWIRVSTAELAF